MKQKTYILENLGCANCAAKMERRIDELADVESATITFATKQLKVTANDPDALKTEMENICRSIEWEVNLIDKDLYDPRKNNSSAAGNLNGNFNGNFNGSHEDSHDLNIKANNSFFKEHKSDLIILVIGAILFAVGVIMEHIWGYDMWFAGGGTIYIITLLIFVAAYILLGHEVLITAARNIGHGQVFDENFLMAIATIAAFCIGEFAEGAGVMLFYRIGELFEDIAVEKSRSQIMDAVDMRPETVMLVEESHEHEHGHEHCDCGHDHHHEHEHCDCGHEHHHDHEHCDCGHDHHHEHAHHSQGDIRIIPAGNAKIGDILLVRPGDRIPLDGIVIEGESRIDTSPVTGEPVPISARPGVEVISGCINEHGVLKIRVTKPLSESMVTKLLDSVENAAAGKPKIDKFITRFARIYTPIVVGLAVLTAIIPSLITGGWGLWIKTAITFLVISCPCALVISVPLAFFSGIGAASKLGILFKGGLAIEALKHVKAVVMDKTGTITKGVFEVDSISAFGDLCENDVLLTAAACESSSSHPIAVSIIEKYRELQIHHDHHHDHDHCDCGREHEHHEHNDNCDCGCEHGDIEPSITPTALFVEEIAGMGIKAVLAEGSALCESTVTEHHTALCGNRKLMQEFGIDLPELCETSGTEILVALDGILIGRITISDSLKDDSVNAINKLKSMSLVPAMLTGDNQVSAAAIGHECGISKIRAGMLPADKVDELQSLRDELGAVMFVGDGINDAPVLAGADVGAAMGSGADAAIEAADVVFMTSSLEAVPQSVEIARYTGKIAMQNIVFALAVKLLVILLGFVGFANIWLAVFADTGVAMLCILNSLRVLWRKYR